MSEPEREVDNLADAIRSVGPSPCDDCVSFKRCASQRLACRQFSQFISTGRWVRIAAPAPSHALYKQLYATSGAP